MVAAAMRTIFAQLDAEHVREAADDITAFADFPVLHWKRSGALIRSNASIMSPDAGPTLSQCSRKWKPAEPQANACSICATPRGRNPPLS
jgi:hypothetical protein